MMIKMKKPDFEAKRIDINKTAEIVEWLGEDFYAATTGRAISVGNRVIERSADAEQVPIDDRFVIIATSPNSASVYAAASGDYLIRYPGLGYRVMNEAEFNENFSMTEDDDPEWHDVEEETKEESDDDDEYRGEYSDED